MKKILIYLVLYCSLFLEIGAQSVYTPIVTDFANAAASTANIVAYAFVTSSQKKVTSRLKDFQGIYNNRINYYLGSELVVVRIKNKLRDLENRIVQLETANTNLTIFLYSKKKKNTKLLEDARMEYDILAGELGRQKDAVDADLSVDTVIYGEKLNLYMNMMRTVTRLNRLLDIVEGNIGDTNHRQGVIETIRGKNNTNVKP